MAVRKIKEEWIGQAATAVATTTATAATTTTTLTTSRRQNVPKMKEDERMCFVV